MRIRKTQIFRPNRSTQPLQARAAISPSASYVRVTKSTRILVRVLAPYQIPRKMGSGLVLLYVSYRAKVRLGTHPRPNDVTLGHSIKFYKSGETYVFRG